MDSPSGLKPATGHEHGAAVAGCPACGTGVEPALPVNAATFRAEITRCAVCGERSLLGPLRALADCDRCGLPFESASADAAARCPRCAAQGDDQPDPALVRLVEHGISRAWGGRYRFVSEPHVDGYLDRLVRRVAAEVPGSPAAPRVALIDGGPGSGALPSGLIVLEVTVLRQLGDEAELAFLLAREIAHLARGHVARMLAGMALVRLLDVDGESDDARWDDEAHDLLALGRGERQELEADAAAAAALVRLGYDPAAATRAVRRITVPTVARPLVAERRHAIERAIDVGPNSTGMTNREPFRRAIADVDPWNMIAADPFADAAGRRGRISPGVRRAVVWLSLVLALAAVVVAVASTLLW